MAMAQRDNQLAIGTDHGSVVPRPIEFDALIPTSLFKLQTEHIMRWFYHWDTLASLYNYTLPTYYSMHAAPAAVVKRN